MESPTIPSHDIIELTSATPYPVGGWAPNNSMEPTRPAAANRVHASIEELAGRLISRPLGGLNLRFGK